MYRLTAKDIAHACGGSILFGDEANVATDVAIDSREVQPDSVFVAFSGAKVDGHDYLVKAAHAGATILLVTREPETFSHREELEAAGVTALLVSDAQVALRNLAVYQRALFDDTKVSVVGITGSTGKTTVKEFCEAAVATQFSTVATLGNQNNELGVPLTILRATKETQVLIVEMGMRAKDEIAELVAIARPKIGLVVSTGLSHIEILGSRQAIAQAKGELIEGLELLGYAVVNADDDFVDYYASIAKDVFITVGENEGSVSVSDVELDEYAHASALVTGWFGAIKVSLPVAGRFQIRNAAQALTVCALLGGDVEKAAQALSQVKVSGMRYSSSRCETTGITIIDDAYNANPTSMDASLRTFAEQKVAGKRIAVLGDMKELGEEGVSSHEKIGALLGELKIDILFAYGPLSKHLANAATNAGVVYVSHYEIGTLDKLSDDILSIAKSGDAVLLKGSRAMELERVSERIGERRVR